jgi:hypothetical protein
MRPASGGKGRQAAFFGILIARCKGMTSPGGSFRHPWAELGRMRPMRGAQENRRHAIHVAPGQRQSLNDRCSGTPLRTLVDVQKTVMHE